MRGTLIGSDLLQSGSSVKILEINTNTSINNEGVLELYFEGLFDMIVSNSIDEFHYIYTEGVSWPDSPDSKDYPTANYFEDEIKRQCLNKGLTYTAHPVVKNSITVPSITDADNKFILRQAFDVSAIVDSTYCADKLEFFKLMSGSEYIPKTYLSGSSDLYLDSFDSSSIDFSSSVPNFIEKSRNAEYDVSEYPAVGIISSNEQLDERKERLGSNRLIQEFISDDSNIESNRRTVIRSIDILYGSDLDVLHLGAYKVSTEVDVDFCEDSYATQELAGGTTYSSQVLEGPSRIKWLFNRHLQDNISHYHCDGDDTVLMADGSEKTFEDLELNDVVKTLSFSLISGSSINGESAPAEEFRHHYGNFDLLSSSISEVTSSVVNKTEVNQSALYVSISLDNGSTIIDVPGSNYLIEESGSASNMVYYTAANSLVVGDKIIVYEAATGQLSRLEVTNLGIKYQYNKFLGSVDVEPWDTYLPEITNGFYAIQHNPCNYCGNYWYPCGNYWCDYSCYYCSAGGICFIAGTKISLSSGETKNIEDIVVGDEVVSYNEQTGFQENKSVTELNQPIHDDLVKYTFSNGTEITCTYDHPFYVNDMKLASYKPDLTIARYELGEVSAIKVGDFVFTLSGDVDVTIQSIEELPLVDTQTYIFSVEDNNNFYANEILTHNKKF